MKRCRPIWILLLLGVLAFTLATILQPRAATWTSRSQADSALALLLGDGRRLFARQFFVKADISFHRGYYPSFFDEARRVEENDNDVAHPNSDEQPEPESGFLGKPTDWIDRFSRHFRPVSHVHLSGDELREILPWLRISAELDPQNIETYTTAAYWLRKQLHQPDEAEAFLREGLRANPNNPELLYELGVLYAENKNDPQRAINFWIAARRRWHEVEALKQKPDKDLLDRILGHLAREERNQKNLRAALDYLQEEKTVSPEPAAIDKQIQEVEQSLTTPPK